MAIALVAHTSGGSTTGNGFTTGSVDTTGANFLIMWLVTAGVNAGAVSDSKSNTWTPLTQVVGAFGDRWSQFFYAENPTVGSGHTFTVTGSSNFPALAIAAFSGVATSSSFDVQNNNPGFSVTSVNTGSITPGANNEVLIAGLNYDDTTAASVDSGFTVIENVFAGTAGYTHYALAYIIETTATAKNPTFSWTNTQRGNAAIASFKAGASGTLIQVDIGGQSESLRVIRNDKSVMFGGLLSLKSDNLVNTETQLSIKSDISIPAEFQNLIKTNVLAIIENQTSIQGNSITLVEANSSVLSIHSDSTILLETASLIQENSNQSTEFLSTKTSDKLGLGEFTAFARVDSTIPFEVLALMRNDSIISLEDSGTIHVTLDSVAPIESMISSTANIVTALEDSAAFRNNTETPAEFLQSVRQDEFSQFEALSAQRDDNPGMVENASSLSVIHSDSTILLESSTSIKRDNLFLVESMVQSLSDTSPIVEFCMLVVQQMDSTIPQENLVRVVDDNTAPTEYSISIKYDGILQVETSGAVLFKFDSIIPVEMLGVIKSDVQVKLEDLGTTNILLNDVIPIESLSTLRDDNANSIEDLLSSRNENRVSLESNALTQSNTSAPLEEVGTNTISSNALIPTEVVAGIKDDNSSTLENTSAYRNDAANPLEAITKLIRDSDIQLEDLFLTRNDAAVQLENTGTISIAFQSELPLENIAAIRDDIPAFTESSANLKMDLNSTKEILVGIRRDASSINELLAGLRSETNLGLENTGTTLVTFHSAAPVEFLASLLIRRDQQLESSVSLRLDISSAGEVLIGVRRDLISEQEFLGTTAIQRNALSNLEWLGSVVVNELSEVELILHTTVMQGDSALSIEFLVNTKANTNVPWEQIESPIIVKIIKALSKVLRMTMHIRLVGPK